MPDQPERSESGSPIYRYSEKKPKDFEMPESQAEFCQQITDHVERHVGPVNNVLHEILSHLVHLDVLVVEPTDEKPFYTLVTSGMSDRPMNVPPDVEGMSHAELVIRLPGDWPISKVGEAASGGDETEVEKHYWPIRLLKYLARFPHEYDTWLGWGHTMPNGDPPEAWAPNTKLCGVILLPSITLPEAFWQLNLRDDKQVHFYSVYPLHNDEMDFKLKKGTDALIDKFERAGVTDVLDPARPSCCARKGWWPF